MRVLPWRRGTREAKAVPASTWTLDSPASMPSSWFGRRRRRWTVEQAVNDAYERTVWMWKGVSTVAGHASRLPLRFRDTSTEEIITDHPLSRLLAPRTKVNPLENAKAFRKRLSTQMLLSDRGVFVELTRSRAGDVVRLDLLPPSRTRPVPGKGADLLSHFELTHADGGVQELDPERVLWIREPHPTDPYRADTPLAAIGMSVEMDDLGRMVNVHWMRNDGLLRAIVAVKGDLPEKEAAKLERRFGGGPTDAGKVSVITADGITYADVSARPRDMHYQETARNAKVEVLAALGVPESQIGNAADRTYANAEAEEFAFWTITMDPHLSLIAAAFADQQDPTLEPFFDVSSVEALQLPQRARRSEARDEVRAGLRSIDSYAELAGITVLSTPETRALWVPRSGRSPVWQTEKDVQAQVPAAAAESTPSAGGGEPGDQPADPAATSPQQTPPQTGQPAPAGQEPPPAPSKSTAPTVLRAAWPRLVVKERTPAARVAEPDPRARAVVEDAAAAALAALTTRWVQRMVARMNSPKLRKGTRHWQADPAMATDQRAGDAGLDVAALLDPAGWQREAEDAVRQLLVDAAGQASSSTAGKLGQGKAVTGVDQHSGAAQVVASVGGAARAAAERLAADVAQGDQAGEALPQLEQRVRGADLASWAHRIGRSAGVAAVEAGRHETAVRLGQAGWQVRGVWKAVQDGKARATHLAAHGQQQHASAGFLVGDALLRFPGDPAGPAGEAINCRCSVAWSAQR